MTVWYLDYDECMHAQVFSTKYEEDNVRSAKWAAEEDRIKQEIEHFAKISQDLTSTIEAVQMN